MLYFPYGSKLEILDSQDYNDRKDTTSFQFVVFLF